MKPVILAMLALAACAPVQQRAVTVPPRAPVVAQSPPPAPPAVRAAPAGRMAAVTRPAAPARPAVAGERVARVIDGDTVQMADGERVRLMGFDTPEKPPRAECPAEANRAAQATARLQSLSRNGLVLARAGRDRYGRTLAAASTPDGRDVAETMIAAGLAKPYHGRGPRGGWCAPA